VKREGECAQAVPERVLGPLVRGDGMGRDGTGGRGRGIMR
jgi:hypothetical protein